MTFNSIDEMITHLNAIMPDAEFHAHGGSGPTSEIIDFINSIKDDVVFCKKCKRVRLDPGLEMTVKVKYSDGVQEKKLELCVPCLDKFMSITSEFEAVEFKAEMFDGTVISGKTTQTQTHKL